MIRLVCICGIMAVTSLFGMANDNKADPELHKIPKMPIKTIHYYGSSTTEPLRTWTTSKTINYSTTVPELWFITDDGIKVAVCGNWVVEIKE